MSAVKKIFKGAISVVTSIFGGEDKKSVPVPLPKIETGNVQEDAAKKAEAERLAAGTRRGAAANILAGELEDEPMTAKKKLLGGG